MQCGRFRITKVKEERSSEVQACLLAGVLGGSNAPPNIYASSPASITKKAANAALQLSHLIEELAAGAVLVHVLAGFAGGVAQLFIWGIGDVDKADLIAFAVPAAG